MRLSLFDPFFLENSGTTTATSPRIPIHTPTGGCQCHTSIIGWSIRRHSQTAAGEPTVPRYPSLVEMVLGARAGASSMPRKRHYDKFFQLKNESFR